MHCERLTEFGRLTAKQREVLQLVSESMTVKEIARELGVSPAAVEQRIRSLRGRFGPLSRAELSRLYREFAAAFDHKGRSGPETSASSISLDFAKSNGAMIREAKPANSNPETPATFLAQACLSRRFYAGLALGFTLGIVVAATTFASLALALRLLV